MNGRRRISWLTVALWVATVSVLAVAGYFGYSVWAQDRGVLESTPAARVARELEAAVRKSPNNLGLRLQLAQAYSVTGDDDSAARQFRAALKLDEDNASALAGLGFITARQKQWKTSEGYWRKVVKQLESGPNAFRDKQLETAYHYLGTVLMEQGQHNDAIGYLKQALRIRRDASDTHYALAVCYREVGAAQQYREELDITLMFDPRMPEANYDKGQLLLKAGDVVGAAECFRISADGAPSVDKPRLALEALGDAEEHLTEARRLEAKDPKKALSEARIAAAVDPELVDAVRLVARLFERLKKPTEALSAYEKVLRLVPQDATATAAIERLGAGGD